MGSGASTASEAYKVGNVEATVVEIVGEEIVRRGSDKPIEEVGLVLLVIDPRNAAYYLNEKFTALHSDKVKAKTKAFCLVPSLTSAPACLTLAEIGLSSMGVCPAPMSLVRLDDYLAYGDKVIVAMADAGKRLYPAEEAANMVDWFRPSADFEVMEPDWGYEGEGEPPLIGSGPRDRFAASIYNFRAWTHWVVGAGLEERSV